MIGKDIVEEPSSSTHTYNFSANRMSFNAGNTNLISDFANAFQTRKSTNIPMQTHLYSQLANKNTSKEDELALEKEKQRITELQNRVDE
jgi:type II restriction/modification system DNA methylase subunit YeeA